jgi:hypothetical protein
MMIIDKLSLQTTGIGSLPHHNVDAALEFSFQTSLPFLPQIPIRNPWEFMIPQSLDGMPGLQVEREGLALLDIDVWSGRKRILDEKLSEAFSQAPKNLNSFEAFEPPAATSSSWQPFLWELEERRTRLAKIQLAGPLTCQWALKLNDGSTIDQYPQISTQIFRLILARALGMCRRLQTDGIQPLFYLDEPGLFAYTPENPQHTMALQEFKILIQALRNEGVWVGLHCCSNANWNAILQLPLHILSIDTGYSLDHILGHHLDALGNFFKSGGRLSLGVIPTQRASELQQLNPSALFVQLLGTFNKHCADRPEFVRQILAQSLYTPACGLALHNTSNAENVLATLKEFRDCLATRWIKEWDLET